MLLLSRYMLKSFGIRIFMYPESFGKHYRKHIHVIFDNHKEVVVDIVTLEQIEGNRISKRYKDYLFSWLEEHQEELVGMFNSNELYRID